MISRSPKELANRTLKQFSNGVTFGVFCKIFFAASILGTVLGTVVFNVEAIAQSSNVRTYSANCFNGAAWHGRTDGVGGGYATLTPCGEEEPAPILSLYCARSNNLLSGSVDYISNSSKAKETQEVIVTVDGKHHRLQAALDNTGMYETLDFKLATNNPLIQQLASGSKGRIRIGGKTQNLQLKGSGKSIKMMLKGCGLTLPGKDDQLASAASNNSAVDDSSHVRFDVRKVPARRGCTLISRRIRGAARTLDIHLQAKRKIVVGERFNIDFSNFPTQVSSRKLLSFVYIRIPKSIEASGTLFQPVRAPQLSQSGRIYPNSMIGQGITVPLYEHARGAHESVTLTPTKAGKFEIRFQIAASRTYSDQQRNCPQPTLAVSPGYIIEVVEKPVQARLAAPVSCHLAGMKVPTARLWAADISKTQVTIGASTAINWEIDHAPDPACRTPLYLVASTNAKTRFEGDGFLAIPKGMPGPFNIQHNIDKTRLFFPLHLLDSQRGQFEIKSFGVGPLHVDWALVEVPRLVEFPKTRNDFALNREKVTNTNVLRDLPIYKAGNPRLVVRDEFTTDQSKKRYRSNSNEFDLHVFENFYRVFDVQSGELVLERTGTDPNFSPGGRFIGAFVASKRPMQVIDLYSKSIIYSGEASLLTWGHGDTIFAPVESIGYASLKDTALKVQQGLVDRSEKLFRELEYYKNQAENFLLSVDLEGGVVAAQDISERNGSDYHNDGRGWLSLVTPNHGSKIVADRVKRNERDCRSYETSVSRRISRCNSKIRSLASNTLLRLAKRGYFDPGDLFALKTIVPIINTSEDISKHLKTPLLWLLNNKKMALSHCLVISETKCVGKTDQASDITKLNMDYSTTAVDQSTTKQAGLAEVRFAQVRLAVDRQTKQISLPSAKKSKAVMLLDRLTQLNLKVSGSKSILTSKIKFEQELDWENLEQRVSTINGIAAGTSPSAAKLIPSAKSGLAYEKNRAGCFTKQEIEGTATEQQVLTAYRIDEMDAWSSEKNSGWLFNTGCWNGATIRSSLWLLHDSRNGSPALVDLSFAFRHEIGGKPNKGKLKRHPNAKYTTDFGEWPETVDRFEIAFDRYLLANGTWSNGRWGLAYDLEQRKLMTFLHNVENADDFGALTITRDGKTLVQANTNGQLFFYNTASGKVILRGIETDDELIVYDENGYYLSSPEGAQFLHLKFPGVLGFNTVRQFASTLNRPDIIEAILSGTPPVKKPILRVPPLLTIAALTSSAGEQREVRLQYQATSGPGLKWLTVYIDGKPAKTIDLSGKKVDSEVTVPVSNAARWISAVAIDINGFESIARGQSLAGVKDATDTRLYVVAMGTDKYDFLSKDDQLNAAKFDAENFINSMYELKGRVYSSVEVIPFLDTPDLQNVLPGKLAEVVAKARAQDTIMFFAAGHGFRDDATGQFFLAERGTRIDQLQETSLAWSKIATDLERAKGRVIVFIDACHSGAAGKDGTNDEVVSALFKHNTSMTIIAAAKGYQQSLEGVKSIGRGGVFTTVLIKAITQQRKFTDTNGNGAIELAELYGFLKRKVVLATDGAQTPWIARNQMVGEIPIF